MGIGDILGNGKQHRKLLYNLGFTKPRDCSFLLGRGKDIIRRVICLRAHNPNHMHV